MQVYLERVLRTAAMTAVAALAAVVSPAHSAYYAGAWDPMYGYPFTSSNPSFGYNLGWRGEALFFVPDACVPSGTAVVNFLLSNPCGTPTIDSAYVELYDLSGPSITLETLNFGFDLAAILRLRFEDGELTGIYTAPSIPPTPSSTTGTDLSLQFLFPPHLLFESILFDEIPSNYEGPVLYSSSVVETCHTLPRFLGGGTICTEKLVVDVSDVGSPEGAPTFTITEVPEPGALALVAVALLASGSMVRLRKQR